MRSARYALILVLLLLAGCSQFLQMPRPPYVLRDGVGSRELAALPAAEHRVEMPILYLTDRSPGEKSASGPEYGFGRATWLAYGTATIGFDPQPTWAELVAASGGGKWLPHDLLKMTKVEEAGRLILHPDSSEVKDGELQLNAESRAALDQARGQLQGMIAERLSHSRRKDVYLYVHGFNNSFYDAVARAAILWHYTGREGVFIAYAWPAGRGGPFGYLYDRESGEFTVLHLREAIRMIARCPQVRRLHIIAHSRGSDVVSSALRELNIECRARNERTREALKLKSLILAAPDLDVDVFGQRFFWENLAGAADHTVIYFSPTDVAIRFARWLFGSVARLGQPSSVKSTPDSIRLLKSYRNLEFINCEVSGSGSTHAYVFGNPAALSDVVRVLDGYGPGPMRPLKRNANGTWSLDNEYLRP